MWGKPTTQAQWKMAAKDIIIAKLKWTHTGIYHISMGYGNLLRRFLYSRRARWLSCFLSPFGFIRKLSATLRMLRRTLDIYLCKNVKSFVKLAVIAQPPHPCPYPHSYPWPPTKAIKGDSIPKGIQIHASLNVAYNSVVDHRKKLRSMNQGFFLFLSLPPSHGRNVARKKSLHKWMAFYFFFFPLWAFPAQKEWVLITYDWIKNFA